LLPLNLALAVVETTLLITKVKAEPLEPPNPKLVVMALLVHTLNAAVEVEVQALTVLMHKVTMVDLVAMV
jgi:hypothetical protein